MKHKPNLNYLMILLALIILMASCGCYNAMNAMQEENISAAGDNITIDISETEDEEPDVYYDAAKEDIFAIENITAYQIKILDMKIGDSADFMLETLGEPDILTPYDNNTIFNCEYGESLGLNGTGLIFHVEGNTITRITALKPFNPFLKGSTKLLNMTKYDAYRMFGAPERQIEEPNTRVFFYDKTGVDILLDGKKVKGFSLREPIEEKEEDKSLSEGL